MNRCNRRNHFRKSRIYQSGMRRAMDLAERVFDPYQRQDAFPPMRCRIRTWWPNTKPVRSFVHHFFL